MHTLTAAMKSLHCVEIK